MNKNIGIIIGIIIIVGIGIFALSRDKTKTNEIVSDTPEIQNEMTANETSNDQVLTNETTASTELAETTPTETIVLRKGSYEVYSAEKIALAETGDVVLFFHASWCPSCRTLSGNIDKNINAIPDGVTILKTGYDKETELKKKYGVTTQHTLVQVDKDGNLIKKWSGGSKLENLLSQIQ